MVISLHSLSDEKKCREQSISLLRADWAVQASFLRMPLFKAEGKLVLF